MKKFLLISALIFAGIFASADLCAQTALTEEQIDELAKVYSLSVANKDDPGITDIKLITKLEEASLDVETKLWLYYSIMRGPYERESKLKKVLRLNPSIVILISNVERLSNYGNIKNPKYFGVLSFYNRIYSQIGNNATRILGMIDNSTKKFNKDATQAIEFETYAINSAKKFGLIAPDICDNVITELNKGSDNPDTTKLSELLTSLRTPTTTKSSISGMLLKWLAQHFNDEEDIIQIWEKATSSTIGPIIMPIIVNSEDNTDDDYLDKSTDNLVKASDAAFELLIKAYLTEPSLEKARDDLTKAKNMLDELPDKDGALASKLNFAEKVLQDRPTNDLLDRIKKAYPQYESYNNDEEVLVSMLNMLAITLKGELKTPALTEIALGTLKDNFEDNIFKAYVDVVPQSLQITAVDHLIDKIRTMILCKNDKLKLSNGKTINIVKFYANVAPRSFTNFFLGNTGTELMPITEELFKDADISTTEQSAGLKRLKAITDGLMLKE